MRFGQRDLREADYGRQEGRHRFAWLPVRTHDGRWLWLERYVAMYEVRFITPDPYLFMFKELAWVFIGRYGLDELDRVPQPLTLKPPAWFGDA